MKHYYPAIFAPGVDCWEVFIPYTGCFTQGSDINECMEMAQDALGVMFEGTEEKDYPEPRKLTDLDLSTYPAGSFASYVCFDKEAYDEQVRRNERAYLLKCENPIKELLKRRRMKIKELSDLLEAPYRTVQDWSLGQSRPPEWVLKLIIDKFLD